MSAFAEVMASNPPRLVVLFRRGYDGGEQFQWGVVGSIPILSLIGALATAQHMLIMGEYVNDTAGGVNEVDPNHPALVLAWDAADHCMSTFASQSVSVDPLVGMLETIKAALVASRMGQQGVAQRVQLLGPDGNPVRVGHG